MRNAAVCRWAAGVALCSAVPVVALSAQTDYYNTDTGRPLQVEDAHVVERRAVELQLAPLRVEGGRGRRAQWGIEPEFAVGFATRTQFEVGFPLARTEGPARPGRPPAGGMTLGGVEVALLHMLNVETALPAMAVGVETTLPVGNEGPDRIRPTFKGILTRTLPNFRVHVNGQVTVGAAPTAPPPLGAPAGIGPSAAAVGEQSRWLAGVSVDRPFPLRALLVGAEVVTSRPLVDADARPLRVDVAAGARSQLSPRVALDLGGGRRVRGEETGWYLTAGAAVAVGLPWRGR
ncbi:MAG: hypothetical protein KJT01_10020 [Gemmatimonadetes bacterium]|nr:hypothetical protein [Gemmatimonadota bacterium]